MPDKEYKKITNILAKNAKKDFVQRILYPENSPVLKNDDDTISTHRMAWGEADGKYYVYPTIIRKAGGLFELDPDEAFHYAHKTGEYIEFDNPEEADWFSKKYKTIWNK
jgi:hypothetical protein